MNKLIFEGYKATYPLIEFFYSYNGNHYCNGLRLDNFNLINEERIGRVDMNILNRIYSYIGIALSIKLFAVNYFDEIEVKSIALTGAELDFFSRTLTAGFGEYRYINHIPADHQIKVISISAENFLVKARPLSLHDHALVCNGGGKDSVVAAEICRELQLPLTWLIYNPKPDQMELVNLFGKEPAVTFHNMPDANIEKQKAYNGHKPLSLLLACLSLLPASVLQCRYIVVANEYSANFANLTVDGIEINHQFTKSWEFEKSFSNLVHNHISPDLDYFSILRPLYEIKIAQLFSKMPRYFDNFISCNKARSLHKWCGVCAKCAFIYLILSAFLSKEQMHHIFGKDLFQTGIIKTHIKDLLTDGAKPFECVGTRDECLLAYYLCTEKYPQLEILPLEDHQKIMDELAMIDIKKLKSEVLEELHEPHGIPKILWDKVKNAYQSLA